MSGLLIFLSNDCLFNSGDAFDGSGKKVPSLSTFASAVGVLKVRIDFQMEDLRLSA